MVCRIGTPHSEDGPNTPWSAVREVLQVLYEAVTCGSRDFDSVAPQAGGLVNAAPALSEAIFKVPAITRAMYTPATWAKLSDKLDSS